MQKNILCVLLFLISCTHGAEDWGYLNVDQNKHNNILPDNWYKLMPECKGNVQSPVDIKFSSTLYDSSMKYISVSKKDGTSGIWNITNDGKTGNFKNHFNVK